MSEIGNYRNPKIQELLDQLVTEERFGDYKPILDEIIQRRLAYEQETKNKI